MRVARGMCSAGEEDPLTSERMRMDYDVVIVGAGPAGLAASIRLKQLAAETGKDLSVCVVEKGAEVGAHILSGNVFEPRALNELIPDWKEKGAPLETEAGDDKFLLLTPESSVELPNVFLPSVLVRPGRPCGPPPRPPPPPRAAQPRQLRHQPQQAHALAGRAGGGAGRGDLPWLRRLGGGVRRGRGRERDRHA